MLEFEKVPQQRRTALLRAAAVTGSIAALCAALLACSSGPAPSNAYGLSTSKPLERIGIGSCLHQERQQPILDEIVEQDFDLFLFMGDNVYGDVSSPKDLTLLEQAYERQAESEELQRLRASTPILAVWDDHDFGMNDAGADFGGKEEAEALFERFWGVPPDAAQASRPGVYDSVILGPPGKRIQILLLDTRFFRSPLLASDEPNTPGKERWIPDHDESKTMLGNSQWRWLEQELERPAELRLLVSSIQVVAEGHGWEAWRTLPAERERLYAVLERTRADGVIVLSGDRHRAGIYRQDEALSYPLYELTSSSLNLPIPNNSEEPGPHRLGPTYLPVNFGSVEVDWEAGQVALAIRDLAGDVVLQESVEIDRLSR